MAATVAMKKAVMKKTVKFTKAVAKQKPEKVSNKKTVVAAPTKKNLTKANGAAKAKAKAKGKASRSVTQKHKKQDKEDKQQQEKDEENEEEEAFAESEGEEEVRRSTPTSSPAAIEGSPRKSMAAMGMDGLRVPVGAAEDEVTKTKVERKPKKAKEPEEPVDPVRAELLARKPKRPAGGAWGVFMEENRQSIMQGLPEGFKVTHITKEGSKKWKAMGEEEKQTYQKKYEERMAVFKNAMNAFTMESISKGMAVILDTKTPTKKRKLAEMTPVKGFMKAPTIPFSKEVDEKMLDPPTEDNLHEAKGLGYEKAFRLLRTRAGILEKKWSEEKLVRALRAAGGSAKKAYNALMN